MEASCGNRLQACESVVWQHVSQADGVVAYRVGRQGDKIVAEWPALARLTCATDASNARLNPMPGAAPEALAKLHGMVSVFLGELRGGLGLHGSAICLEGAGILVLGASGAGKSTTAAAMCSALHASLLSDDTALLQEVGGALMLLPTESAHYLSTDSARALGLTFREGSSPRPGMKAAADPTHVASHGYAVRRVLWLEWDDSIRSVKSRRLSGSEAATRVLGSMFRFDFANEHARRRELDYVAKLCEQAPVMELRRPRTQPDVTNELERVVGGADGER